VVLAVTTSQGAAAALPPAAPDAPEAPSFAAATPAAVTAEASTVKLDLPMPVARLRELIEQGDDQKKPASGPTTKKSDD